MSAPGLSLYRAGTYLAAPLINAALARRADAGKEDPSRLDERRGAAGCARPEGPLIWIHAASVGESLIALSIAEGLLEADASRHVLISSGTRTSAGLIAQRGLDRVIHQFPPVDRPAWATRFLDHWRPDLAVFVESELWPNLILGAKQTGTPLALINARMNDKSLAGWRRWPGSARRVLGAFDWIGAADQRTADGLSSLAARAVPLIGSLKLEAGLPEPDVDALTTARAVIGDRPLFVAASTHDGEEALLAEAHAELLKAHPDALMILAPRHPERAEAAGAAVRAAGLDYAQRSAGETPEHQPVWLADTLGEMPLWFTLAPAAVIAGSFQPGIGGHNPIEASRAGAAVISGPHRDSFADVYAAYEAEGAVQTADTARGIAAAIAAVWAGCGPDAEAASRALAALPGGARRETLSALEALLHAKAGS